MSNIIDRILAEVCLDDRVTTGTFDMENSTHMQVLFETMTDKFGVSLNDAKEIHNKMLEGKYPERQAYNRDGLLVTFPTPQHKAKAISRGTHFEKDPTKGPSNVFGGGNASQQGQQPPAGGQPPSVPGGEVPSQNVFSQGQPATPAAPAAPPSQEPIAPSAPTGGQSTPSALPKSETPPLAPATPAAPPGGSSLPSSDIQQKTQAAASDKQGLAVEPPAPTTPGQPTPPAPPPNFNNPKPPEQRAAEAHVVKQIMAGNQNDPTLNPTFPVNVNEMVDDHETHKVINLILQYATYGKESEDPKAKQQALVTIEGMTDRLLKKLKRL